MNLAIRRIFVVLVFVVFFQNIFEMFNGPIVRHMDCVFLCVTFESFSFKPSCNTCCINALKFASFFVKQNCKEK